MYDIAINYGTVLDTENRTCRPGHLGLTGGKIADISFRMLRTAHFLPLSAGDTYYSVYLLCALVGMLCLISWQPAALRKGEACWILAAASLFSGAVVLANYDLFSPFSALENMFHLVCTLFGGVWVGGAILLWMYQKLPASGKTDGRNHPIRVFFLSFCMTAQNIGILITFSLDKSIRKMSIILVLSNSSSHPSS